MNLDREMWLARGLFGLAMFVLALLGAGPSAAQVPPAPTNTAVRIAEARKANAALMRQYSWTSRTEVIDQGQVKDLRLDAVNHGPGGVLQRTAPLPRGFLRRRIAEDERRKVEEYLTGLRDLLEQYTLPTAGKVQDFMSRAKAAQPDAAGLVEVTGRSASPPRSRPSPAGSTTWPSPR